ncbi:hypothetical protein B0A69_20255 [Chryseobacterium shigense]|uniref:Uncharacterized protein n=1 Tax=Chryseobacterium shigense TaxID=297244 RepID=A0A1N7I159_9FLAO|nr:hypothetical protein [Chryseobacterium shigense]PQA90662.1 hypothetical protein B0A69_20255 [Chryseobacterium shigense]SIS30774.1 hypothetical protein SAMN05421639_1011017 [Chryseobacterium shigense]
MPAPEIHIRHFKAIILMLVLAFSLSPCSLKRDLLDIFDIQYVSALNKVKTTTSVQTYTCDSVTESSSNTSSVSKSILKFKDKRLFTSLNAGAYPRETNIISQNNYSGHSTENSPPKYILFKRLKLHLV